MALSPGTRFGSYEILSPLGAGGMGEVYRARDTRLGRDVALKVLPEAFTHDSERIARFQREAHTLAALNHPNIGGIYGLEEAAGVTALVMELVEGDDLSQRIGRGPIPLDEALPIAKQIAEALEAAHEQGIIHRDLKPANIKVRSDGTVKVLDFGLAKAMESTGVSGRAGEDNRSQSPTITSPAMTRVGMMLGTAAYMSPEQARGRGVDRRADIWAFGVVLFEMVSGDRPFGGETISDTVASILKTEPDWPALPTVPAALRHLLRRCLEKDPKDRLQAIGDARLAIDDLTSETADLSEPSSSNRPTHERRAWIASAALLLVAVAALSTAAIAWRRPAPAALVTRLELSTPPTEDPFSFALSPDGRQIVYVAEGGSRLWLRPLDQATAQPLDGTDGASFPFWVPDGHGLGFFADNKLKRMDFSGAASQVLTDLTSARGGTWNRDGVLVFAPGPSGLRQLAVPDGTPTPVTRLAAGQTSHRWPQFLPDGRHFLFFAQGSPDVQGVYVGSLDGGEPTRLLAIDSAAAYAPPGYLLWVSQGALVARPFDASRGVLSADSLPLALGVGVDRSASRSAFSVSATGVLAHRGVANRRQLQWVNRTGQPKGVLGPPEDTALSYVELSPDEHQVATHRNVQGNDDIWLIEATRGVVTRFTSNASLEGGPVWSPDGRRVAFRSGRNGTFDLFEKDTNGSAEERPLLVTKQHKAPQSWSSDGKFLLFTVLGPRGQSKLWAMSTPGDPKPFPVMQTDFDQVQGQFSPDGRWIAYASNESGRYEVSIRPFPDQGGARRVSTDGGVTPRWRHDGKELFYVAPDNRMMAAALQFSVDGRIAIPEPPSALFSTRLTSGNFGVGGYASRAQYAVATDDRFLLNVNTDDATPIAIVHNWTSLLKK